MLPNTTHSAFLMGRVFQELLRSHGALDIRVDDAETLATARALQSDGYVALVYDTRPGHVCIQLLADGLRVCAQLGAVHPNFYGAPCQSTVKRPS